MVAIRPVPHPTLVPCCAVGCSARATFYTYRTQDGMIQEVLLCLACAKRAVAHRAAKASRNAVVSRN